jgi:hypothetical protein
MQCKRSGWSMSGCLIIRRKSTYMAPWRCCDA